MKAVFYYGRGDLRLEEVDIPKIHEDEMLIKVKACAVCGTDLRIFKFGHFKIPEGTKRVLGHEVAGEIVQVGSQVRTYSAGMRVAIVPNIGCGTCQMCIEGFNQMCPDYEAFGISLDGGFQEYILILKRHGLDCEILITNDKDWKTKTGALRNEGWYLKMFSKKNKDKELFKALKNYTKLLNEKYGKNAFRYFTKADMQMLC